MLARVGAMQENADRIARRMWRPHSARAAAADVVERALHTGRIFIAMSSGAQPVAGSMASCSVPAVRSTSVPVASILFKLQSCCRRGHVSHLSGPAPVLGSATSCRLHMVDVYAFLVLGAAAVLTLLGWLLWGLAVRMRRRPGPGRPVKAKAA